VSAVSTDVEPPRKTRLWWFWWAAGWVMLACTINESLQRHVWEVAELLGWDKATHFTGYFLLTTWFTGVARRNHYWLVGLLLMAFGGALEIAQGLMHEGRSADWLDFLANSLGIAAGIGIASLGFGNWMVWIEKLLRVRQ
jgi:VanZ family protein